MSHHKSQIQSPDDQHQRSYNFISPSRVQDNGVIGRQSFYNQPNFYGSQGFNGARDTLSSQNSQPLRFSGSQSHLRNPVAAPVQQQQFARVDNGRDLQTSSLNMSRSIVAPHQRDLNQSVALTQTQIIRSSDETRDRIIQGYREEIKVQPQRDRDYRHLNDMIADLQKRIRSLEGNLQDSQRDYEESLTQQTKIIHHHQGEIETLKKNVLDREQEGIKVYDEIQGTKRDIEDRESEIYTNNRDIEQVRKHNEQIRRESELLQGDINQAQDVKKRQQQAIYQLKNDIRFQEKEIDDQKMKAQVLEKESKNLNDRSQHLNETVDQRSIQVERTVQKLDGLERDISILKQNIISIDVDINDVERSNDRSIELQKQLLRSKDQEIVRAQDQTLHLRELETRNREAELQVEHLRKDLEGVRYSNDALLDRNHDLKLELESLNQHSELLTSQNRELQRELDSFVETDDIVRRNLDRKEKVTQIRAQVDEVIQKSIVDLVQRSPRRARSPVKFDGQASAGQPQYNQLHTSQYQPANLHAQTQVLHNNSTFGRSDVRDVHYQREQQQQNLNTSQLRQSYNLGESVNFRGSPLRRGQLENQY